jgi:hypothetical protein
MFAALSVCGANGNDLCTVGAIGPGGGTIVWIDTYSSQYEYDYIEASNSDLVSTLPWSTSTPHCGINQSGACDTNFLNTFAEDRELFNSWGEGSGQYLSNQIIERHDAGGVSQSLYAAGAAAQFCSLNACDWFLPSFSQLLSTYMALKNGANALTPDAFYWSSSPYAGITAVKTPNLAMNLQATGPAGGIFMSAKSSSLNVRIIRTF